MGNFSYDAGGRILQWGLSAFHDFKPVWAPTQSFSRLGPVIGNNIQYDQTGQFPGRLYYAYLGRRFKFVNIFTYHSADGFMHLAFGMPNRMCKGHGSAYLGFKGQTASGAALQAFTEKFWNYLSQRLSVLASAAYAKGDVMSMHPEDAAWVINFRIFGDPSVKLWR
jgi:hypothetical protein